MDRKSNAKEKLLKKKKKNKRNRMAGFKRLALKHIY